jgi:ectoine hydroxylase
MLTPAHVESFERDGFALVDNMFSPEETAVLVASLDACDRPVADMPDANGRSSKISLWVDVRDDAFGVVTRHPRIITAAQALLREDVYHWHSKIMRKEAKIGGAWEWHQDYGYWYGDKCPYPRLISCMVALDRATKENGCLQVIPGSHLAGRLNHGQTGNQAGADPERVAGLLERLPAVHCEMAPGSALFFHCNLLHSSEANTSDYPRRAYICCYNGFSNIPFGGGGHGRPERIKMADDGAIMRFADQLAVAR